MKLSSIGVRLTLWYVGLLGATLLVLASAAYILLTYSLQREVDAALESVAETLADRAKEGHELSAPGSIEQIFRRYFGFAPLNPYFEMLDPKGRPRSSGDRNRRLLLSQQALDNASRGVATFETISLPDRYPVRVFTRPVVLDNRVVNLVQVGMSLERTYQTRRHFILILAAMLPVGLALAGGGGWLLARRSLKPVHQMTQAAQRISAFRLSERLEESGTGDELDELAQTLNQTLERLDESFNQMRQFSADASHELQTPLTVLKGEIEVALRAPRSTEEYRNTLQSSLEEIDRLAKLVEGLLFLARADSGVLKIDQKNVNLTELIQLVQADLMKVAGEKGVELRCLPTEPVILLGDPILLRQLVQNVVLNGLKYTPDGGTVSVTAGWEGNWATMTVSDTGQGIAAEDQEKIFQRFYRSAKARSEGGGGAGLGLSIAKSIVNIHKGEIEIMSSPGSGTTFTVRLPRNHED